jgi:diacylglycerol kinase (ATP)
LYLKIARISKKSDEQRQREVYDKNGILTKTAILHRLGIILIDRIGYLLEIRFMVRWIPIIINPAAGQKTAVLKVLNQIFHPAGVRWTVEVTHGEGDAFHQAQQLAVQGAEIIAVYGGDGTISEVATAIADTESALAILPGGTGNVLTYEFQIPRKLIQAAKLLTGDYRIKVFDLGQAGERKFLLRVGVGFESLVIEKSQRKLKDRYGLLAYGIAGLQALKEARQMHYRLNLDGTQIEIDGLVCTVANSGHLGLPGLSLSPTINMEDGLLDVIVLKRVDVEKLISSLLKPPAKAYTLAGFRHWQAREIRIDVDPPQSVQLDGDIIGISPIEVVCHPKCLKVVVPAKK